MRRVVRKRERRRRMMSEREGLNVSVFVTVAHVTIEIERCAIS